MRRAPSPPVAVCARLPPASPSAAGTTRPSDRSFPRVRYRDARMCGCCMVIGGSTGTNPPPGAAPEAVAPRGPRRPRAGGRSSRTIRPAGARAGPHVRVARQGQMPSAEPDRMPHARAAVSLVSLSFDCPRRDARRPGTCRAPVRRGCRGRAVVRAPSPPWGRRSPRGRAVARESPGPQCEFTIYFVTVPPPPGLLDQ